MFLGAVFFGGAIGAFIMMKKIGQLPMAVEVTLFMGMRKENG